MPLTPGTRLSWTSLSAWIEGASALDRRRCGAKRHKDLAAHWRALPAAMIETAPLPDLARFIALIAGPGNAPWHPPRRGLRRGTQWEALNVTARNRRWRLERAAELAEIGVGHNSAPASRSAP